MTLIWGKQKSSSCLMLILSWEFIHITSAAHVSPNVDVQSRGSSCKASLEKSGVWTRAIKWAILILLMISLMFGVTNPGGRLSAKMASFRMCRLDVRKQAWCRAPVERIMKSSGPCLALTYNFRNNYIIVMGIIPEMQYISIERYLSKFWIA